MEVQPGIKRTAVICLLKSGNQLLLLKRKKDPNMGLYTPIGGKLDPHENPNSCAVRETQEETGIQVNNYSYIGGLIETSPNNYNWNSLVYAAEIPYQPAPPCNEGLLEWIDIEGIENIPTPATDAFIYQYYLDKQPFLFNAVYNDDLEMLSIREEIQDIWLT